MTAIPFTLSDALLTIYRADANGEAIGEAVWIGSCEQKLTVDAKFAEEEANIPGQPWVNIQQLEERHEIDLENVWLARQDGGTVTTARFRRNERWVFVLLWINDDSHVWVKRVYFACTISGQTISPDEQVFAQRLQIRSGWFVETAGVTSMAVPDSLAVAYGLVRYVSASETVDLYLYDFEADTYTAIDGAALTGRAEIAGAAGDYQARVLIEGDLAAAVDGDGVLLVKKFTAIGGTFVSGLPRLEFVAGNQRVASLSKDGELGVTRITEAAADPELPERDFQLRGASDWLASIAATGLYAAAVDDGSL